MSGLANRSRLFELRRDIGAARRSSELLERKREVLLHEVSRHRAAADALRQKLETAYAAAHAGLQAAEVEAGRHSLAGAALAQAAGTTVTARPLSVMAVSLLHLEIAAAPFRGFYGTAGTTASVDETGQAFDALLQEILTLAEHELAVIRLELASKKTGRLLNALKKVIVPRLEREIRAIAEGLEEEERDEAVRVRRQIAHHARA
jgi:H(+)-transporting ATP synthase subunit D